MAADFLPSLHESQLSTKEEDMMSRIRSSAHTLARMVEDLLDLSLLEAQRLKLERIWVDPSALVYETIDRLSHLTGDRRVKVIDGHMSRVFVDPMRIGQVLGNLVSNAVKYGERDKEIVVRLEPRAGEVEVAVTNYGKGIEAAELPRIFNRFARTKMSRGSSIPGLGLGLYISKGVIEAHGGRMWVESTPGATTTFHVTLPAAAVVHEAA
jgi:signal transduction histidine kinase